MNSDKNKTTNYQWDAKEYASQSTAQQKWARELIGKLRLSGDEKVLDIGCGDGKVTAEISLSLGQGKVVGIDSSEEMVALAASSFRSSSYPSLSFELMDAANLTFHDEFDVVFSNAVLHWVIDHQPVLTGIFSSLKNGGRVLVQMGGKDNAREVLSIIDRIISQDPWHQFFHDFSFPYGFYGPDEYRTWLVEAGFVIEKLELIPKNMVHDSVDQFKGWIRTTWLPYLGRIPEPDREEFIDQLTREYRTASGQLAEEVVTTRMMRLEFSARKEV